MADDHFKKIIKRTHETLLDLHGRVKAFQKKDREKNTLRSGGSAISSPHPGLDKDSKIKERVEVEIRFGTMVKFIALTLLLIGVAFFLNEIREIIIVFFVSLLFAAALDPMVDSLERKRIPRSIGILIIYVGVISIIGLFIANLAPIVAKEVSELASKVQDLVTNLANGDIPLPSYLERLRPLLREAFEGINVSKAGNYREVLLKVAQQLSSVAGNVFNAVMVLFNGFFNAILILVITYLMTVDEVGIDKFVLSLFPARYGDYIRHKSRAIKEKMGYWLRGQVILCIVVGILVYVGFGIIGIFGQRVEYAATIALLAGFTELIPYAGPFIAWLLALPIVANQSIPLILWMTMLMYLVQLLENNFIVPIIMNKAVGISPILIMFAMLVGFEFLGVLGIVLSVPVATTFAIFLKDYADRQK